MVKLRLIRCFTNVKAYKIDNSIFDLLSMILANFWIQNKFEKTWFFKKKILIANINMEIVLKILLLIFYNINILFVK